MRLLASISFASDLNRTTYRSPRQNFVFDTFGRCSRGPDGQALFEALVSFLDDLTASGEPSKGDAWPRYNGTSRLRLQLGNYGEPADPILSVMSDVPWVNTHHCNFWDRKYGYGLSPAAAERQGDEVRSVPVRLQQADDLQVLPHHARFVVHQPLVAVIVLVASSLGLMHCARTFKLARPPAPSLV